jgi:hypothetical protein
LPASRKTKIADTPQLTTEISREQLSFFACTHYAVLALEETHNRDSDKKGSASAVSETGLLRGTKEWLIESRR